MLVAGRRIVVRHGLGLGRICCFGLPRHLLSRRLSTAQPPQNEEDTSAESFLAGLQKQAQDDIQKLQQRQIEQEKLEQQRQEQQKADQKEQAEQAEIQQRQQQRLDSELNKEYTITEGTDTPSTHHYEEGAEEQQQPQTQQQQQQQQQLQPVPPTQAEWKYYKRVPSAVVPKLELQTGAKMIKEVVGKDVTYTVVGSPAQVGQAKDLIRMNSAIRSSKPVINKILPTNNELVKLVEYRDGYAIQLVNPKEGGKDTYDAEDGVEEFFRSLLTNLTEFRGEILVLGRFGKNMMYSVLPEACGPFSSDDLFSDTMQLKYSSFVPQIDNVGMLGKLPGGQGSEAMDIRMGIRSGYRWDNVTLRLTVVDGKLFPFRAYLGTYRNAIDQISLYTNCDIRLSLHTYPILPDDHYLFPKINKFFDSLSLQKDGLGYRLQVHPSNDFMVHHARYKLKQSFIYKSRYNPIGRVKETSLSFGAAETEVEISDIKWTERFEYNLPGSTAPLWDPHQIVQELPEFVNTIRSLGLLVRHKE